MALAVSAPYPLDEAIDGCAVLTVRTPDARTWELVDGDLVKAAQAHAQEWEEFAGALRGLIAEGWHVHGRVGVYATRVCSATALAGLAATTLQPGAVIEWSVPDDNDDLIVVGGLVAGFVAPRETFPGATLPALVVNDLTGAQRRAHDEDELRAAVRDELAASATWWRSHPQELSDHDAHELPDELDELAGALEHDPAPTSVMEPMRRGLLLPGTHRTRLTVHPVSAIVFAGLLEAVRCYPAVTTQAPREGQAGSLRRRGEELAGESGLLDAAEH